MADAMTPKAVKLSDQISERSNQQQNSSYDDLASHQNEPNANKMNGDSNAAISLPAADSVSQVSSTSLLSSNVQTAAMDNAQAWPIKTVSGLYLFVVVIVWQMMSTPKKIPPVANTIQQTNNPRPEELLAGYMLLIGFVILIIWLARRAPKRRTQALAKEIAGLKKANGLLAKQLTGAKRSVRTVEFKGITGLLDANQSKRSKSFRLKGLNWYLTLHANSHGSKQLAVYLHQDDSEFLECFSDWSIKLNFSVKLLDTNPFGEHVETASHVFEKTYQEKLFGFPAFASLERLRSNTHVMLSNALLFEVEFESLAFDQSISTA